jgi:hypothetical protein
MTRAGRRLLSRRCCGCSRSGPKKSSGPLLHENPRMGYVLDIGEGMAPAGQRG